MKRLLVVTSIFIFILIVLIFSTFFLITKYNLDSEFIKNKIESKASSELGKEVAILGSVDIHYGLWPSITINDLKIGDPRRWGTKYQFADVGSLRLQIGLIPLLQRKIKIRKFILDNVIINWERKENNENNSDTILHFIDSTKSEHQGGEFWQGFLKDFETDSLIIRDLTVNSFNSSPNKNHKIEIERLNGSILNDKSIELDINGYYQKEPYKLKLIGGTFKELINSEKYFPVKVEAEFLGAVLKAEGAISEPLDPNQVKLSFSIQGNRVQNIENFFDFDLPKVEGYKLNGQFEISEKRIKLYDLEAQFGVSKLSANLIADLSKEKPNFEGKIHATKFDLLPFLNKSHVTEKPQQKKMDNSETLITDLSHVLGLFDAKIDISIDELIKSPFSARDIFTSIEIRKKKLKAPIGFNLEGIKMYGALKLGFDKSTPTLNLTLKSHNPDLHNVIKHIIGKEYLKVRLETLDFELSTSGENLHEMIESLKADLSIKNANMFNYTGQNEKHSNSAIKVDIMEFNLDPDIGIVGSAHGKFLTLPTSINISTCKIVTFMAGKICDIRLTGNNKESRIVVSGDLKKINGYVNTHLMLDSSITNLYKLKQVFDDESDTNLPLKVSLEVRSTKNELTISDIKLNIGQSDLSGEFSRKWSQSKTNDYINLEAELIDINQLSKLVASDSDKKVKSEQGKSGHRDFDVPIFTAGPYLINTEFKVYIKQLAIGKAKFKNTYFYSNIVEGHLSNSEFATNLGKALFKGKSFVKLTSELPRAGFYLETTDVDIGKLLKEFGITDDINIKSEQVYFEVSLVGSTLEEALEKSTFNFYIKNGVWELFDETKEDGKKIEILESYILARYNEPIKISLNAIYNDTPAKLTLETDNVIGWLTSDEQKLPVKLEAEFAGVNFNINGWVLSPLSKKYSEFTISINGNSLDSINHLLQQNLPGTEQYEITGTLKTSKDDIVFQDFEINVGGSTITGYVNFADYQNLDIEMLSHSIELNDFIKRDKKNNIKPVALVKKKNRQRSKKDYNVFVFRPIISALNLENIYAQLKVNFDKVLINDQFLGSLELNGDLKEGKLNLDNFEIHTPGGTIYNLFKAQIIENVIKAELVTMVKNFDYGFLETMAEPDLKQSGGIINLRLDIDSYGENIQEFDDHVSGFLKIQIMPKNLKTEEYDIWATNLLYTILPKLKRKSKSKMNCIVGGWEISNGLVRPKKLYIDTSNVRVRVTSGFRSFTAEEMTTTPAP